MTKLEEIRAKVEFSGPSYLPKLTSAEVRYLLRIAEAAAAVPYPVTNRHDDTRPARWEENLQIALRKEDA